MRQGVRRLGVAVVWRLPARVRWELRSAGAVDSCRIATLRALGFESWRGCNCGIKAAVGCPRGVAVVFFNFLGCFCVCVIVTYMRGFDSIFLAAVRVIASSIKPCIFA